MVVNWYFSTQRLIVYLKQEIWYASKGRKLDFTNSQTWLTKIVYFFAILQNLSSIIYYAFYGNKFFVSIFQNKLNDFINDSDDSDDFT